MASATPWYADPITQAHGQQKDGSYETGIDLGTPFHTPLTVLYPGTVEFAGRTQWNSGGTSGGAVAIRTQSVPGLPAVNEIYLHVDQLQGNTRPGAQVTQGQTIALSGGQNQGGQWPADPQFSSGAHTEYDLFPGPQSGDINAIWSNGWQKAYDPTPYIMEARLTGGKNQLANPADPVQLMTCIKACNGNQDCIKACITAAGGTPTQCAPWDINCMVGQLFSTDHVVRGALFVAGLALVFFGVNRLTHGGLERSVMNVVHGAGNSAKGAAELAA